MSDTSLLFTIFAVDRASETTGRVGKAVDKLALGIGAAAAGIAIKTTAMAANFQTQMLRLQTSAGEQKSNMALVSNGVLDLATKTGDSTKELAAAMYTVESGGQHGADGLKVLQAAAEGAKAEGADLNVVADATTSILQDYHLKASDAALVTSQLVATTGAGKTTFEALAGSLHSVLPVASAAHIALSDILGAEASMTVHGMSADQVTQNLSDTIRHLVKPTQQSQKEMGQLGINASSLGDMLSTKGLTGTVQYLSQTILSKMGPSGKILLGTFTKSTQAAADEKQMIAGMSAPMADLAKQYMAGSITSKQWSAGLKAMSPEQANQMKQFATLAKTASGFSSALKSGTPAAQSYTATLANVMGDATGLNTALMLTGENTAYTNTAVATISKTTAEAGGHVRGWAEIQATFNVRMAQAKEQVEVLGIRVGTALLPYMTKLATALGAGVSWLSKHKTVARDAAIVIGSLAAAVLLYKTYQLGANVVDKIGTGYQIAKKAVMATVTGLQWAWNVAVAASNANMWTWIGIQAIDFAGWVRKTAVVAADTVVMWAQLAAIEAVSLATKLWAAAQWLINVAMDANPVGLIILGVAALVAGILYLWFHCKPFRNFMIAMWHDIWDVLKAIGSWFAGPFKNFFVDVYHFIMGWATRIYLWIHDKIELIKAVASTMWNEAKAKTLEFALWIGNKVLAVVNFFKALPGKIWTATTGMFDGVKNAFKGAVDWIIGKWNGLKFSIPSVDFMGFHTPGFTLGVPQIPMLARGGTAFAGGAVVVGDRGPETMYLPRGAGIVPDGGRGGRAAAGASGGGVTLCLHLSGTAQALAQEIGAYVRGNYGGNVQLALQGHG